MGPPYAIAAHHVALCLAWSSQIQVVLKEETQQLKAVSLHVSLQFAMGHAHGVRRRQMVDELLKVAPAIRKGLLGGGRLCLYLHWGPPGYLWSLTIHRCLVVPPFVYQAVQFGRDSLLYARSAPFGIDAAITADLMSALGRNNIDVVLLNRADPVLYHRVLRDGVRLLTRHPRATAGRESYALSRYFDFLPQLEKIRRAADARADEGHFGR